MRVNMNMEINSSGPVYYNGVSCCDTKTHTLIEEFRQLYEEKMRIVDSHAAGDFLIYAKMSLQQDWIHDLSEQNELLVKAVEELEVEAKERACFEKESTCACSSNLQKKLNELLCAAKSKLICHCSARSPKYPKDNINCKGVSCDYDEKGNCDERGTCENDLGRWNREKVDNCCQSCGISLSNHKTVQLCNGAKTAEPSDVDNGCPGENSVANLKCPAKVAKKCTGPNCIAIQKRSKEANQISNSNCLELVKNVGHEMRNSKACSSFTNIWSSSNYTVNSKCPISESVLKNEIMNNHFTSNSSANREVAFSGTTLIENANSSATQSTSPKKIEEKYIEDVENFQCPTREPLVKMNICTDQSCISTGTGKYPKMEHSKITFMPNKSCSCDHNPPKNPCSSNKQESMLSSLFTKNAETMTEQNTSEAENVFCKDKPEPKSCMKIDNIQPGSELNDPIEKRKSEMRKSKKDKRKDTQSEIGRTDESTIEKNKKKSGKKSKNKIGINQNKLTQEKEEDRTYQITETDSTNHFFSAQSEIKTSKSEYNSTVGYLINPPNGFSSCNSSCTTKSLCKSDVNESFGEFLINHLQNKLNRINQYAQRRDKKINELQNLLAIAIDKLIMVFRALLPVEMKMMITVNNGILKEDSFEDLCKQCQEFVELIDTLRDSSIKEILTRPELSEITPSHYCPNKF